MCGCQVWTCAKWWYKLTWLQSTLVYYMAAWCWCSICESIQSFIFSSSFILLKITSGWSLSQLSLGEKGRPWIGTRWSQGPSWECVACICYHWQILLIFAILIRPNDSSYNFLKLFRMLYCSLRLLPPGKFYNKWDTLNSLLMPQKRLCPARSRCISLTWLSFQILVNLFNSDFL